MSPATEPVWSDDHPPEETRGRRRVEANSGGTLREALDDFLQLKELVATQAGDRLIPDQPRMVSRFYDVVTRFYEYGWGQSFHFAPRRSAEGLHAAQRRQEAGVAEILNLKPGMRVADIGCGVGGPAINIARATGASITGLNFNAYQIARCRRAARAAALEETCDFLLANYLDVPLADGCFDAGLLVRGHLPFARQGCLFWRALASAQTGRRDCPDGVVPYRRLPTRATPFIAISGTVWNSRTPPPTFRRPLSSSPPWRRWVLTFYRAGTKPSIAIRTLPGTGRFRVATSRSRRWRAFRQAVG